MILQKLYWHIFAILKLIFYKILYGANFSMPFSSSFRERFNVAIKDGSVCIGKNVFFNNDCSITAVGSSINIGDNTILGENVKMYCHNHCYHEGSRLIKEQGYTSAPIKIGENCWITSNVVILKGVTIGDNCVIGAGCIIYKNVESGKVLLNKQELVCLNN